MYEAYPAATGKPSTKARNVDPPAFGVEVGLGLIDPDLVGIAAESFVLDASRPDELVDRGDPPGRYVPGGATGACRPEHHPDRDGSCSSGTMPSDAEPLHEIRRRARFAELPFGTAAATALRIARISETAAATPSVSSRTLCTVALCGPVPVPR